MPAPPAAAAEPRRTDWHGEAMRRRIARRYARERRFHLFGLAAVVVSAAFLAFLLVTMLSTGVGGFQRAEVAIDIDFPAATGGMRASSLAEDRAFAAFQTMDVAGIIAAAAEPQLRRATVVAGAPPILSAGAPSELRERLVEEPGLVEQRTRVWLPASSAIDRAYKSEGAPAAEEALRRLTAEGRVRGQFNLRFLTGSDATDASQAGIWSAFKGSLLTMVVTLLLAFPIGVAAALYLEEFAAKNRITEIIEVSINNLAAVPSIIFGLLGLVVFINWFGMPRSSAIVGGLTLALMTMPVIVIAGRNAIKAVPPSIREAALGIGASPVQVVFHHVLPLAVPGILTGTIIGMARALGETAPLIMIGMRAFISSPPDGLASPSTVLPMQIYLWSDEVDAGFVEKTSAAIIILLIFLLSMNALAIYLRNRFETRW
jgi:phosphate transport system permease protein